MTREDRKLGLWLGLGTAVAYAVANGTVAVLLRDRLPDPLGIHWGPAGLVDGTGTFWLHVIPGSLALLLVTGLLVGIAVASGMQAPGSRWMLAGGIGLGGLLASMLLAGLVGQVDRTDAMGAPMHLPTLVIGSLAGILWAVFCGWLYRPLGHPETGGEVAPLPTADTGAAASGRAMTVTIRAGRVFNLLLLVPLAILVVVALAAPPYVLLVLIPAALLIVGAGVVCLRGRVVVDPRGIRVYGGGFWRMLATRPAEVRSVEVREIKAMEYGGWGYRISGHGIGFITGSGPALIVRRKAGMDIIYSVDTREHAEQLAGLLGGYASLDASGGTGPRR